MSKCCGVLAAFFLILRVPALAETETHVSWTLVTCARCHPAQELEGMNERVTRPCRTLCVTCHEFREKHHAVGVEIPASLSPQLLLTAKGTNTCVTCHDVTRPRHESSPWISQSLFDRVARRAKDNRTFYLVMRNNRGQLCRNCH